MKRFEPLTKEICEQLEQNVSELIKPLSDEFGTCLASVKGKLSKEGDSVTINVRLSIHERPDSVASLKEEQDFKCYAEGFGMQANWLGKAFQRGNFTYKVVGLMVDAPNKCAILQRSDGARCCENGKLVARYLT